MREPTPPEANAGEDSVQRPWHKPKATIIEVRRTMFVITGPSPDAPLLAPRHTTPSP